MTTYTISGITLYTTYEFPSIPVRQFDWTCIDSDYDGAPDAGPQLHGTGATEVEAIVDYLTQLKESLL
jgi:hypothetical protein